MLHNPNQPRVEIKFKPIKLGLAVAIAISVLVILFALYFWIPVLNPGFLDWVPTLIFAILPFMAHRKTQRWGKYAYIVLAFWVLIALLSSAAIFRAKDYRNVIGKVKLTEFSELIQPVRLDQIPTVDLAYAAALAEKTLGEDFALGSRVTLGRPTRQMVDGSLYWVIPLLHSGFFKWLANTGDGTPGYIKVSAINPRDVEFVRQVEGKPVKIKYQPNAYFNQDLRRHIYLHGYANYGIGGYTFELDDNGQPYWTITLYTHEVGVRAPDAAKLITIHAETGKIAEYPLIRTADGFSDEKVPAWVDRVQPAEFILTQLDWWGKYVRGFWNTVFSKRNMLMVTAGYNIVYGTDGRSYVYSGMTSVGADEGTVGFVLSDTRTKRTHLYKMSGATEYAAMRSAEGKVQNYKYSATFPILVNLNGLATYFMPLKDGAGLVKQFAFVSVKDYSVVGVGETIKAARDDYQMALSSSRVGNLAERAAEQASLKAAVSRIGIDIKEGKTYYYLSFNEAPGAVFIGSSDLSNYLPLTKPGDVLSVEYLKTGDKEISIISLRNESLEPAPEAAPAAVPE